MKICIFAAIDVCCSDAAILHISGIANALSALGEEIVVFLPRASKQPAQCIQEMKVPIKWGISAKRWKMPNSVGSILNIPMMVHYVRQNQIEVVYIRSNVLSFFLTLALRLFTRAKIVTEHNGWIADESRCLKHPKIFIFFEKYFQKWDAVLSHKIRSVTEEIAKILISQGVAKDKITVLGNGVDLNMQIPIERSEALRLLNLVEENFYLGFVGNLAAWQGVSTAIAAMPALIAYRSNIQLIIAGDGIEKKTLEAMVAELNLQENVIFLGMIPPYSVKKVVSAFDIAIAPFSKERNEKVGVSALKIRDYAALSRVVMTSDLPGTHELLGNGWLYTFQADNQDDFARKTIALIENTNVRTEAKTKARAYAESHFSWAHIAAELKKLFEYSLR